MRPAKISILKLFVILASCASGLGENVWINWSGPTGPAATAQGLYGPYSYRSGATGTLTLGPTLTNVTYTGETISAFSSYSGGNGSFWSSSNNTATPAVTYTSATVPTAPPSNERIAVAGFGIQGGRIAFDQTVTNVAMTLWSLGGIQRGQMTFNQDFSLVSSDKSNY